MEENDRRSKVFDWSKAISLLILTVVICYKLSTSDFTTDTPTLLSFLLALFSISLSALFYFKATETSNKFYDNSFRYTKQIAELLVGIENKFTEKFQSLNNSYINLREEVVKFASEHIIEKQNSVKDLEAKKEELLNKLVDDKESASNKDLILENFKKLEQELEENKLSLNILQNKLEQAETFDNVNISKKFVPPLLRSLLRFSLIFPMTPKFILSATSQEIKKEFEDMRKDFSDKALQEYRNWGLLDKENDLTEKGVSVLKELAGLEE